MNSQLKELAEKNHKKIKKIGLIDPDNSTVVSDAKSVAINAYMSVANLALFISLIWIMMEYENMGLAVLIIFGVSMANMAAKTIANAVQQHDTMIKMAEKLRAEYEIEKDKIIDAKIQEREKNKNQNKIIYDKEKIEIFKNEIHKAAVERAGDDLDYHYDK